MTAQERKRPSRAEPNEAMPPSLQAAIVYIHTAIFNNTKVFGEIGLKNFVLKIMLTISHTDTHKHTHT